MPGCKLQVASLHSDSKVWNSSRFGALWGVEEKYCYAARPGFGSACAEAALNLVIQSQFHVASSVYEMEQGQRGGCLDRLRKGLGACVVTSVQDYRDSLDLAFRSCKPILSRSAFCFSEGHRWSWC